MFKSSLQIHVGDKMVKKNERKIYSLKCIVTGKEEKYEEIVNLVGPMGRSGEIVRIPQKKSCLNYQCKYRNTNDCPLELM
jgi:hypothetical protein